MNELGHRAYFDTTVRAGVSVGRSIPVEFRFAFPIVFVRPANPVHTFQSTMVSLSAIGYECYEVAQSDIDRFLDTFHKVILVSLYQSGTPLAVTIWAHKAKVEGYVVIFQKHANNVVEQALDIDKDLRGRRLPCPTIPITKGAADVQINNWLTDKFKTAILLSIME